MVYLSDPTSAVAKAFGAERTPHAFVFDADGRLAYVGTIDDSPGDAGNVKERYLERAIGTLGGVATPSTKAFGCTIKFAQ